MKGPINHEDVFVGVVAIPTLDRSVELKLVQLKATALLCAYFCKPYSMEQQGSRAYKEVKAPRAGYLNASHLTVEKCPHKWPASRFSTHPCLTERFTAISANDLHGGVFTEAEFLSYA